MRKTLLIIVMFVIAILSIPIIAFADMDAPGVEPYKAHISKVEGVEYFDYTGKAIGKLNYGDVITVYYEYENHETKELNADFKLPNDEEGGMYSIRIEDIKPVESKVENLKVSQSNKKELTILKEGGIELSKGPAYVYEKTGVVIPNGEKITGYRSGEMNSSIPWFYITYKGTTGWICELDGAIGTEKEYEDLKLMMPKESNIYKNSDYTKTIAKIPANTIVTEFLELDPWSQGYYVTYEGKSGYISMSECANNFPWIEGDDKTYEYKVNYPEVKLYKEATTKSEVLIENIPEGEVLRYEYSDDMRSVGWIYTSYNNISGWAFYVEDGLDYKEYLDYENEEILTEEPEKEIENKIDENVEETETVELKENNSTMTKATQIVILCAMWGLTIFVTSIVTIALVNKKKKE